MGKLERIRRDLKILVEDDIVWAGLGVVTLRDERKRGAADSVSPIGQRRDTWLRCGPRWLER